MPRVDELTRALLYDSRRRALALGHSWDVADVVAVLERAESTYVGAGGQTRYPEREASLAAGADLRLAVSAALADLDDIVERTRSDSPLHARLMHLMRTLNVPTAEARLIDLDPTRVGQVQRRIEKRS